VYVFCINIKAQARLSEPFFILFFPVFLPMCRGG